MKKSISFLGFLMAIFCVLTLYAQPPDTLWTKVLSGYIGNSVFSTADGGFVVGGYKNVSGYRDFYICKTDDQGEMIWEYTYGNSDISETLAQMIETSDGGYLLCGNTSEEPPYSSYSDVYLVKTDEDGIQEWYSVDGVSGESESPSSVAETSDGGFIITGSFWYDGYNGFDVVLIKVNELGAFEWKQYYNLEDGKSDRGLWVETAPDGGFLVTGETQAFTTNYDYDAFILKTNPAGTMESLTTIGEEWPMYEGAYRLLQCTDGSNLICGYQNDDGIDNNWYVVKTGTNGWTHTIGGTYHDKAFNACETSDGGYAVTGNYYENGNWNCFVVRYNSGGDTLWTKMWGDPDHSRYNYDIKQLEDGGFITVGSIAETGQNPNIYLARLEPETVGIKEMRNRTSAAEIVLKSTYPNPFEQTTTIFYSVKIKSPVRVTLFDVTGRQVATLKNVIERPGDHEVVLKNELPAGIYFCTLQTENQVIVEKIIKRK